MEYWQRWVLLYSLIIFSLTGVGQTIKRSTISSFGPSIQQGRVTIQSCVGQPSMIGVDESVNVIIRNGFLQPIGPYIPRVSTSTVDRFSVFPVPTLGDLNVEGQLVFGDELVLYDGRGNLVFKKIISKTTSIESVTLDHLSNGYYNLIIQRAAKIIFTTSIIKGS